MRRTGTSTCRRRHMPRPPRPRVAAPQFEVMYLLSGCDAGGVETLRERLDRAGRIGGHRGVGSTALATTRCTSTPTMPVQRVEAALVARHAEPHPDHVADRGGAGARPPGGWTRERAVLAVVDGDGAAELFAGEGAHVLRPDADGTGRAPSSCCARSSTPAPRRSWCCPTATSPPRNSSRVAPPRSAGASTWCRCPPASMVQGLAALAVHDADRQAVDDGYTMARAAAGATARLGSGGHRGGADLGGHLQTRRRAGHRGRRGADRRQRRHRGRRWPDRPAAGRGR